MKKVLSLVFVLLLLSLPVFASDSAVPYVVDNAQLLSSDEYWSLSDTLESVSAQLQMDVVVVTVPTVDGKSLMDYADDFYDYNGYRPDGVLLLVCMGERGWWISTSGNAISTLTDATLDRLSEAFVPLLSQGRYAEAFETYAEGVLSAVTEEGSAGEFSFGTVLICLLIGAVVAFIVTGILKGQLKSVRRQNTANNYICDGSLQLTKSRDMFLYRNVSRRAKPQNNGSSTHRSSSGRSHGGTGGRF